MFKHHGLDVSHVYIAFEMTFIFLRSNMDNSYPNTIYTWGKCWCELQGVIAHLAQSLTLMNTKYVVVHCVALLC